MTESSAAPRASAAPREGWVATQFALSGLVWGASFLFIAIALTGMTPVQVAAGRAVLGALTLGLIVLVTRDRLPAWGRIYGHLAVVGVTFCVLPYLLFSLAGTENQIPFGGTAVLIIVGVGLETVKQVESQLMLRNYEGFLR
ncbi:MAG: EamA family transporter [Actinomycetes bacterium]